MKRRIVYFWVLCIAVIGASRPAAAMKVLRSQNVDSFDTGGVVDREGKFSYVVHAPQVGQPTELIQVRLSDLAVQKRLTVPPMDGYAAPRLTAGAIDPQGTFIYFLVSVLVDEDHGRFIGILKIRTLDLTVAERIPIPTLGGLFAQGRVDPTNRYYVMANDSNDSGPSFFVRIRLADREPRLASIPSSYAFPTSAIGFDVSGNAAYVLFNTDAKGDGKGHLLRVSMETLGFREFALARADRLLIPEDAKTAFVLRTTGGSAIHTFLARVDLPELTLIDEKELPVGSDPTDTARSAAVNPDGSYLYVGVSSLRLKTTRTIESFRLPDLAKQPSLEIPRDAFELRGNYAGSELYALTAGYLGTAPGGLTVIDTQNVAQPPVVSISSPTTGATYNAPAAITLIANATDSDGISKVEFFAGTKALTTDTTAPYWITWAHVEAGTYTITAKATDKTGSAATSAPITVIVNSSGHALPYIRHIEFSAATQDEAAGVYFDRLAAFFDACRTPDLGAPSASSTTVVHQGNLYTYSSDGVCALPDIIHLKSPAISRPVRGQRIVIEWTPVDGATAYNVYYGTAPDLSGAQRQPVNLPAFAVSGLTQGASYYFSVTAVNAQGESPRESPSGPVVIAPEPRYPGPYTHTPAATRQGKDAAIAAMSQMVKGLEEACRSVRIGTPSLGAIEILNNGPVYRGSQPVTCTPKPNIPPSVVISSPTNGAAYTAGANINLIANAVDEDGIAKVEFFAGTKQLTTDTLAPYWITWQNIPSGTYAINVRATDYSGQVTVSAPVSIVVSASVNGINPSAGVPLAATVFAASGTGSNVRVFPNPWRGDRDSGRLITFDNLPASATLKLFTASAHFVKTLTLTGTTASWDLTNDAGQNVASGMYLYAVTAPGVDNNTGLITIIR